MLEHFKKHIDVSLPFLKGKRLLLACSGGVDSVVLAHLCTKMGLNVTLAHCNFGLRGEESDGDETFVKNLGKALGVEVWSKSFNTKDYLSKNKGSVQMAARDLRYHWFKELLESHNLDYILTAHHADDSLETFLINLSRGTGIDGLSGIPEQNDSIVRPLLAFSREDIVNYANKHGITWREDSSNQHSKYLRNKIRLEIVPKLKQLHPTFLENYRLTQGHLGQTKVLVQNHIDEIRSGLFKREGDIYKINIEKLEKLNPIEPYLYELFHNYGFTEWNDVKDLLNAMSGKEVVSKTHRLLKDRDVLILSEIKEQIAERFLVFEDAKNISTPISLQFEQVETVEKSDANVIFLDKEKLNFPLQLRKWEKGDYFYPFGMLGKKKLSKYFKDEKFDMISKEKQWLMCSNDQIVWVVGKRADERFKVDSSTQQIVKVTLIS
ncbi:tRNA lysidine(34) synthetase TilS [Flagellimonas nanhaiensis]|uniref:tRNA(Ile)-lysidine synthase n=1 Tax=Flagellimonas nanhaiensis TaxID=2292706 RepID=A0A371JUC7_9FLAO|nr:tRNA lysidine(34) synthetase TilS [Allomuricauda nanhaiensis]RDY61405.1 tRNA lysidine(34) synthetase TilS [Allomuricauda nanhaiensis]